MRYIHQLWGATGCFWQSCWDHVYHQWFHEQDFLMIMIGTFVVTTGVVWSANAFFHVLDTTTVHHWALKYKIQENKKVDKKQVITAVKQVLFNQTVVGIPFLVCATYVTQLRGCPVGGDLPTFHWVMIEILIFSFVLEICFYYTHRLLHHPRLYKYVHERHHAMTTPFGITTLSTHPIEYFSNILIHFLGPLLMGSHLATSWLWFSISLISTTIAHSGYHLPLLHSPEAHDYHHLKLNQNFGALGVLDRLHGTDKQFRASRQYQRHFMTLSFVPLKQQYPDSPKMKPE